MTRRPPAGGRARRTPRLLALAAVTIVAGTGVLGCSDDGDGEASPTSTTEPPADAVVDRPVLGPAELDARDQEGDGSSVVVASVTLPSPGYVVVHADAGSQPGQVLGHSELLPEGTSTDVVVPLDEPLGASALVWPMAHLDLDDDGTYDFAPPGDVTDGPARFGDGRTATLPVAVTVAG